MKTPPSPFTSVSRKQLRHFILADKWLKLASWVLHWKIAQCFNFLHGNLKISRKLGPCNLILHGSQLSHALEHWTFLTCILIAAKLWLRTVSLIYRVVQKLAQFLYALTLPNIRPNRFSIFSLPETRKFVIIRPTNSKDPTIPQVCRSIATLWNVMRFESRPNNWKQEDFCNNTL